MKNSHETDFLLFDLIAEFRANLRHTVSSMIHNNRSVLSLEMAEIMICLGENGKLSQQEVVQFTFKDKASVSRLTKKLTDLKLVSSEPGTDHRSKLLHLTIDGVAIYQRLSAAVSEVYDNIQEQLTPGEYTFLIEVIRRLARNVDLCNA